METGARQVGHFTDVTLSLSKGLIILRCPTAKIRAANQAVGSRSVFFMKDFVRE